MLKRAILISAGRGSRLGALTEDAPKCLAKVAGAAILDHQIAALRENGVDDIHVVVGFKGEAIAQHFSGLRPAERPRLINNPFWSASSSIGSVWAARHLLNEPFCLINGDTIFDAQIIGSALRRTHSGLNLLVDGGRLQPDDMLVAVEDNRVKAVSKGLAERQKPLRSLGVIISTAPDGGSYNSALERVIMQPDGRHAYHHAIIDLLAKEETVHAVPVDSGRWMEIDQQEDIKKFEDLIASMERTG